MIETEFFEVFYAIIIFGNHKKRKPLLGPVIHKVIGQ